jgi:hypothetical protein
MIVDPQVYNSPTFDATLPERADQARAQYQAPENVPQETVLAGTQANAAAHLTQQANGRQEVSAATSADAALDEMSPMAAYRWLSGPTFAADPSFNAGEHIPGVQTQLSKTERTDLMEAKSSAEFEYRVANMERYNYNNRLMGDNMAVSFGMLALDPSYLAIDAVSMGAGHLAAAAKIGKAGQRMLVAGTAGAGAAGVVQVEGQTRPLGTQEIVLGALLNGAASAAFYNPVAKAIQHVDPEFPTQPLHTVAAAAGAGAAADEAVVAAVRVEANAARTTPVEAGVPPVVDVPVPATAPTIDYSATLPKELAGAKPNYAYGQKQFTVQFESDVDRAAYITSQRNPSKADAAYVEFVQNATGMSESQVRAYGAEVRAGLKAQAKDAEPGVLTVAKKVAPVEDAAHVKTYSAGSNPKYAKGTASTAKTELKRIGASQDPLLSALANRLHDLVGTDIPLGVVPNLKRSAYDVGRNRIGMRAGADDWVHMHEITHALTAHRLRFGRENPTSTIGGLTKQIDELQVLANQAAKDKGLGSKAKYYLKNADEFMAGLYSGDKEFYDFLKSIPVEGGNALHKLVDTVRKILGIPAKESNALTKAMGLTDDLMAKQLRVATTIIEKDGSHSLYTSGLIHEPPAEPSKLAAALFEHEDSNTIKIAKGISWSLHKTLSSFSPEMRNTATLLVDDALDMTGNSAVSQTRAIRADLSPLQYKYEDQLKALMAEQGAGLRQRIFQPVKALERQAVIEKQVALEMLAREDAQRLGKVFNSQAEKPIKEMADSLEALAKATLAEMKASGVRGADTVLDSSGYFSRRWDIGKIENIEGKLIAGGLTEGAAKSRVVRMLAQGMRRANGWDADLAGDIAKALVDRTRRKGYFEDSAFRSHAGNDNLAEIRDILEGAGVRGDRLQRAMDVMAGVTDEAGKASVLKHRISIDMKAGIQMPDGSFHTIADMIDTNLVNITDRYLDTVAGRSGLARLGLEDQSALDALRKKSLASIKGEAERGRAAKLLDDTINAIQGRPTGDDMPALMRTMQAATRMVGLSSSGLWQVTEYAPMMARYGALRTLKHMLKEMPGARQLYTSISKDIGASTQLKDILTRNSSSDIRMRPFVQRLEDNFEIPAGAHVQLAMSQAQQLVPYMNAQKFVQTHQARVMANLMVDTLHKAAKGDVRAMHAMEQYGLKPDIMVELADDIKRHGMDTALWSDGTWAKVRGPLTKAADDAVLRNRTGEIPAFAQFSQLGKFIFTFRSFVLGAHNKVLAGTLARDGLAGISLALLYQFPLSLLANLANATIQGKPIKDEKELVAKSLGQMGAFGLFSEVFGVVSGQKQQFGAPGLIMIDRLYKAVGQAAQGNGAAAVEAAVNATPILAIIPVTKAIGAAFKE